MNPSKAYNKRFTAKDYVGAARICTEVLRRARGETRGNWLINAATCELAQQNYATACEYLAAAAPLTNFDAGQHYNHGYALYALGHIEQAIEAYRAAVRCDLRHAKAHHNLAKALDSIGDHEGAQAHYQRALEIEPERHRSAFSLSMNLLLRGRWQEGWPLFERRLEAYPVLPKLPYARWQGPPSAERVLLLHAEQAFGDTIQFARFAPVLAAQGVSVVLQVQPRLVKLLSTIPGGVAVHPMGKIIGSRSRVVEWAPLLSVPHMLNLTPEAVPLSGSYLRPQPERVERWRATLPTAGLRIGIAWQGNPKAPVDQGRSIPLHHFAPIAAIKGVTLVPLQKGFGSEQMDAVSFGQSLLRLPANFDEGEDAFLDSAALMHSLDLVITSDTAVAHLAGALGRPVMLCLQKHAEWRWLTDRPTSPWYDSMQIYRQQVIGNWAELFARLAQDIHTQKPSAP